MLRKLFVRSVHLCTFDLKRLQFAKESGGEPVRNIPLMIPLRHFVQSCNIVNSCQHPVVIWRTFHFTLYNSVLYYYYCHPTLCLKKSTNFETV